MELELKGNTLRCYDTVLETTILREEMMEAIVPDAFPDILRVLDTAGKVCLAAKQVQEGLAELSGTVELEALYLPESAKGVCRLAISVPFRVPVEAAPLTADTRLLVVPSLRRVEARVLNPRKVLARVELAFSLRAWAPAQEELFCALEDEAQEDVELLKGEQEASFVAGVEEKSFSFSDDLSIASGRPAAERLLTSIVSLAASEARLIGGKLIFKGEAVISLLYTTAGDEIGSMEYTLPFSQIMEFKGVDEDAVCSLTLVLTRAQFHLAEGGGRIVSVSLGVLAQAVARQTKKVSYIADLYSTSAQLTPQVQTRALQRLLEEGTRRQSVREVVETGGAVSAVFGARVTLGQLSQSRDGDFLTLSVPAELTCFYQGEDGAFNAATRTIPVSLSSELPSGALCTASANVEGEVFAAPAAGGIEVRFSVCFDVQAMAVTSVVCVSGARLEAREAASEGRASLLLRRTQADDRLWDIAKRCQTTVREIAAANGLSEEESLPPGRLLLIPFKR